MGSLLTIMTNLVNNGFDAESFHRLGVIVNFTLICAGFEDGGCV